MIVTGVFIMVVVVIMGVMGVCNGQLVRVWHAGSAQTHNPQSHFWLRCDKATSLMLETEGLNL